jgi:transposase-like protein
VSTATASYKGHRYPVEIINHCVWLYFRFSLSFREVEELMLAVRRDVARGEWSRSIGGRFVEDVTRSSV